MRSKIAWIDAPKSSKLFCLKQLKSFLKTVKFRAVSRGPGRRLNLNPIFGSLWTQSTNSRLYEGQKKSVHSKVLYDVYKTKVIRFQCLALSVHFGAPLWWHNHVGHYLLHLSWCYHDKRNSSLCLCLLVLKHHRQFFESVHIFIVDSLLLILDVYHVLE